MNQKPRPKKVRIAEINPRGLGAEDLNGLACFLGLSVDSLAVNGVGWISQFLPWSVRHFSRVELVLGDFMHRLNLDQNADPEDDQLALRTRNECDVFHSKICDIVSGNNSENVTVARVSDLVRYSRYAEVLEHITSVYSENVTLSSLIDADVQAFLNRKQKRGDALTDVTKVRENSIRYILEELAVFRLLKEIRGDLVHLYLGTHSNTVKSVVRGEVDEIREYLKGQPCVDLYLSRSR